MSKRCDQNYEWYTCCNCEIWVHRQDIGKHYVICKDTRSCFLLPQSNQDTSAFEVDIIKKFEKLPRIYHHGFIKNKCFYAVISPERISNLTSINLQKNLENKIVLLPLQMMMMYQIKIGDLVHLQSNSKHSAVRIAWSSELLPPTFIGISELVQKILSVGPHNWLLVKPYKSDNKLYATEIILLPLIPSTTLYTERRFISHVLKSEDKNFYAIGCFLFTRFLGKLYGFLVTALKGIDGKEFFCKDKSSSLNNDSNSVDSLINDFEFLKINMAHEETLNKNILGKNSEHDLFEDLGNPEETSRHVVETFNHSQSLLDVSFESQFCPITSLEVILNKMGITDGAHFYHLSFRDTKLHINSWQYLEDQTNSNSFELFGGITEDINILRRIIHICLGNTYQIPKIRDSFPVGALLYGPSGSGKTLVSKLIASENHCYCLKITPKDIMKTYYREREAKVTKCFQDACERAPSLIIVDDLPLFLEESGMEFILAHQMDILKECRKPVFVLALSSQTDLIPPGLKRCGRFQIEVEIGKPTLPQREQILHRILLASGWSLPVQDIEVIAHNTHGFFGGDLNILCQTAFKNTQRRNDTDSQKDGENLRKLTLNDLEIALCQVKPSGLRDLMIEVPKVHWSDIGGQEEVKHHLQIAIELPLLYPECLQKFKVKPSSGILMYGPPGCSKTLLAKAVATECRINFISISAADLFNKWVGETERAVKELYRKAKASSPCIIFLDEIDALAPERGRTENGGGRVGDRLLGQLLTEMDGISPQQCVLTMAATNRPDQIDKALLRPGRLDHIMYVPLPDELTRREIFKITMRKMKIASDVDIETLVQNSKNYSGAEVVAICEEAVYLAGKEYWPEFSYIRMCHFMEALKNVKPRITNSIIKIYDNF